MTLEGRIPELRSQGHPAESATPEAEPVKPSGKRPHHKGGGREDPTGPGNQATTGHLAQAIGMMRGAVAEGHRAVRGAGSDRGRCEWRNGGARSTPGRERHQSGAVVPEQRPRRPPPSRHPPLPPQTEPHPKISHEESHGCSSLADLRAQGAALRLVPPMLDTHQARFVSSAGVEWRRGSRSPSTFCGANR